MTRDHNPHVPASVHTNRLDSWPSVHFDFNISGECEILQAYFIISCPCNFYCFFQILSIYVLFICIFLYICHCLRVPSSVLSICLWCRPHSVLKHFSFFYFFFSFFILQKQHAALKRFDLWDMSSISFVQFEKYLYCKIYHFSPHIFFFSVFLAGSIALVSFLLLVCRFIFYPLFLIISWILLLFLFIFHLKINCFFII